MWQQLDEGFWQKNRTSKVDDVTEIVSGIIDRVRDEGDSALLELTEKFDKVKLKTVAISREEIEDAYEKVDPVLVEELEVAAYNIQRFHEMQLPDDLWLREVEPGVTLGVKSTPLERVGCYIPGGRAAYPSTAMMTVIPARVAGVEEVICCTPAPVNPAILVAMDIAGADEIYAVGGAQAIAAMALGTETIEPVQKIVGPGNVFVTSAKMMLRNVVDIDFPAGPSEVGIIADSSANAEYVAADMIAQAEHDPSSAAILVTDDKKFADEVGKFIEKMTEKAERKEIIEVALKNSGYIIADSLDHAIEIMNDMAPEHLCIQTRDALDTLSKVRHAGSIFVGPYTPVAAGDYASGTNHVLPTAGNAKVSSGLNVAHFRKTSTVQLLTKEGLQSMASTIKKIAETEGLMAHSKSVKVRLPSEKKQGKK
ncbi:MAG: histidinol dehydrogenase [Candidatus Methanomethylophilaceae archaeon]|nr:histidinol dehydrogenase [Candidatus Methanomethylophilaceae archaeon]